jgi:lysyl-tRNA synthetase class I
VLLRRPDAPRREAYAGLFEQDRTLPHWSFHYARRLAARVPPGETIVIQTSMSPSGRFHIGNFRDTVCAQLVGRALAALGRRSSILLSFDDYDRVRASTARARDDLSEGEGLPLAAGGRTRDLCRAYVAELKALGICPADADADGRGGTGWDTHYQAERYREGRYLELQRDAVEHAPALARLLGAVTPSALFSVYCEQCGRDRTELLELDPDGVRYVCRLCGAVATSRDLRHVKPAWAVDWTLRVVHERIACEPAGQDHCSAGSTMDRTPPVYERHYGRPQPVIVPYGVVRQFDGGAKISGSRGGGLTVSDLLRFLPPRLVVWLYARVNCRRDLRISLDRAAVHSYYAEFDRFLAAAARPGRARTLLGLIGGGGGDVAPLPPFRRVVSLLQAHWFDDAAVAAALGDDRPEVLERIAHARAWLSAYGRDRAWIVAGEVAEPPGAAAGAVGRLLAPGRRTRADCEELYLALFGTRCGPPLARVVAAFGEERVAAALRELARSGRRPLREQVLANLDRGRG